MSQLHRHSHGRLQIPNDKFEMEGNLNLQIFIISLIIVYSICILYHGHFVFIKTSMTCIFVMALY